MCVSTRCSPSDVGVLATCSMEMRSEMERTTVAVIGGGVGGLAAAVALLEAGVDCLVFERDGSLDARKHGYGMTLSADAKGPLGALGILEACRRLDCVSTAHWVFDGRDGAVVGYYGRALAPGAAEADGSKAARTAGSLRVQRQQLREVLYGRVGDLRPERGVVRWGKALADYREDDGGVVVTFRDGTAVACDVLVGCDGLRSEVRRLRELRRGGPERSPLTFLHIGVVVGVSRHRHALVEKRGFYVLDGAAQRVNDLHFNFCGRARSPKKRSIFQQGSERTSLVQKEPNRVETDRERRL